MGQQVVKGSFVILLALRGENKNSDLPPFGSLELRFYLKNSQSMEIERSLLNEAILFNLQTPLLDRIPQNIDESYGLVFFCISSVIK